MKSRGATIACLLSPGLALALLAGCGQPSHGRQQPAAVPAATITLRLADEPAGAQPTYRQLERPAVFFAHPAHLQALGDKDCRRCHAVDDQGRFLPGLKQLVGVKGRRAREQAYHRVCIDCHRQQARQKGKAAPVLCGQCHGAPPGRGPAWSAIRFDLSLHQRHLLAMDGKCERCHHVYDEKLKKLVWKKNTESACRDCHGRYRRPEKTSLADASHAACVGCHLRRLAGKRSAGPVDCLGCHTAGRRAGIKRLEKPPPLERGQAERMLICQEGAKTGAVFFEHRNHETRVAACHQCHHRTMNKCSTCHRRSEADQGGGVTLERAYHDSRSAVSCVGCHRRQAEEGDCRGCHFRLVQLPAQHSCPQCHQAPIQPPSRPQLAGTDYVGVAVRPLLGPLSEDRQQLPERIEIKVLAAAYQPAVFPHLKIVKRLDEVVRRSSLASVFHGRVETLCSGCHHHQPLGARPAPCRSCHDNRGSRQQDRPSLYTAYHRQCVGCHQQLRLKQGCNDCHRPAAKEVSP
ncbi:MAG: hypothetical protein DRI34_09950 [Deltaproteobacteria bacterium]|nr:MAG: hypothetical protein DRI34_09950 [Deltaproteobacteria bacterium]